MNREASNIVDLHPESPSLNILSLCSGIGGMDLGVKLANPAARTVCYAEREAYAIALLQARMEDKTLDAAPIWTDLITFDGRPWRGKVDLITASLPCQPYSCAGKRLGDKDERALWPEFIRIVSEVRPSTVFIENVPGFIQYFRPVGERLSEMGYRIACGMFTAEEAGAPHKRERCFILADSQSDGSIECRRIGWQTHGHQAGDIHHWPSEPNNSRMVDGLPCRMERLRALGNACVPVVAAYAYRYLESVMSNERIMYGT